MATAPAAPAASAPRARLAYPRALLKISGEAFAGTRGAGGGIDFGFIDRLGDELKNVAGIGVQLGLVVGGGNIVRGSAASEQGMDRVSADYMGMLATVLNALALQDILERKGVDTRVMTAIRPEELAARDIGGPPGKIWYPLFTGPWGRLAGRGGSGMRWMFPSLEGVRPRSDARIAFSIAFSTDLSQGWIVRSFGSGAATLAT